MNTKHGCPAGVNVVEKSNSNNRPESQPSLSDTAVSGIFNIGTGRTESFQDVAEEMAVKYNASIEYVPMPDILKGNYQEYTCADMTLLNGILNDNSNS